MAIGRSGLYKTDVKHARELLIAQGKHPSVDAVRIALGNTGSKSTIHKYLRELQEEERIDRKTSLSEVLQDLVERLAGQLQVEANEKLQEATSKFQEQARSQAELISNLRAEAAALTDRLTQTTNALAKEEGAHSNTRSALQELTVAHRGAEQRITGLEERLYENEQYRVSLEQKHEHARQSLEHFCTAAKEQRDQDQRQHEHQVQQLQAEMRQLQQSLVVKQEDVTRLNQEGARLISDLSHTRKALHEERTNTNQLRHRLEVLQEAEQRARVLEVQLTEKAVQSERLAEQVKTATEHVDGYSRQVRELELSLATVQARLDAQQAIADDLRNFLNREPVASPRADG